MCVCVCVCVCAFALCRVLAQKNTHKVAVQTTTTGFSVQKRAFAAENADTQIDVDDPDFWRKVLPDLTSPAVLLSRLNDRTATRNKAARAKFIEDLEEMVTSHLTALEEGTTISQKQTDTAVSVLVQATRMTSTFSVVRACAGQPGVCVAQQTLPLPATHSTCSRAVLLPSLFGLHCIALHCIALHCIALHCIVRVPRPNPFVPSSAPSPNPPGPAPRCGGVARLVERQQVSQTPLP